MKAADCDKQDVVDFCTGDEDRISMSCRASRTTQYMCALVHSPSPAFLDTGSFRVLTAVSPVANASCDASELKVQSTKTE